MSAIVRRVLRAADYPQPFQCRVEQGISMLRLRIDTELTILRQDLVFRKLVYGRMDRNYSVFSGCGLDAALEISLFKISREFQYFANSPAGVTHNQNELYFRIIGVLPERLKLQIRKRGPVLNVIFCFDRNIQCLVFRDYLLIDCEFIHLLKKHQNRV